MLWDSAFFDFARTVTTSARHGFFLDGA